MELHAPRVAPAKARCLDDAVGGGTENYQFRRAIVNRERVVAHDAQLARKAREHRVVRGSAREAHFILEAVHGGGRTVHAPAVGDGHELQAKANTKHGDAPFECFSINVRGAAEVAGIVRGSRARADDHVAHVVEARAWPAREHNFRHLARGFGNEVRDVERE